MGQEDPLEKEMVAHSSILAWEIPWTEEPGGLSPKGRKESDTAERLSTPLLNSPVAPFSKDRPSGPASDALQPPL